MCWDSTSVTLQTVESTPIEVSLEAWLALTKTAEATAKEIRRIMEEEMNGGAKTGFGPFKKDGEIYFLQRWILFIGMKN